MLWFGFLVIRRGNTEEVQKRFHERDDVVKAAAWESTPVSRDLHGYEEDKLVYNGVIEKHLAWQNKS